MLKFKNNKYDLILHFKYSQRLRNTKKKQLPLEFSWRLDSTLFPVFSCLTKIKVLYMSNSYRKFRYTFYKWFSNA